MVVHDFDIKDISVLPAKSATAPFVGSDGPADVPDARMPRRPGMAGSGLDPIGELADGASMPRSPRL
ncbi:MAG: hypothetical protein NNA18_09110, partial [Nitrospira sp.]|nr:hypothetical protein [Nitrospira sp.]